MNLIDAIAENDIETVKLLLERGANPNLILDEAGVTPLHHAAQNNALEIVMLLFTAGANLDSETDEGETPLDVAMQSRHTEMIQLIRKLKNQTQINREN